jgi:hypothetical protein
MFRNRFFEAGVDAKVSPRVAKGRQSVTEGGGGGDEKVSPSFFKLLIFFLFRQVSVHQSPRLGWPEREETTAEGGGDLEKHCGRTLFSILSMDRLID